MIGYTKLGGSTDIMANFLVKICYMVVYKSMPVCKGIIHQDKVAILRVVLIPNSYL